MVDEIVTPEVAPIAPVEPVAPAVSPEPTIAPVEPSPALPPEPTPASEAKSQDTLLNTVKSVEEKSAEVKLVETKAEEKSVEPAKEEVVAPVFETFKLPENITVDENKLGEFTKALSDFEITTKAPHEEVQKLGQQFLDRHLGEMQRYTESLTTAWNKQRNDWKDATLKDPEFSNRIDTVLHSASEAVKLYGGDAKQQQEFREVMETSGLGNHPAVLRMLSNIMVAKAEGKPLAAPQIATPVRENKLSKMYGKRS